MTPRSWTPIRCALRGESTLQCKVKNGLSAVQPAHTKYFDEVIRKEFSDSLDIDAALKTERPLENRWDYLLGHAASKHIVAVEPHSARDDEIKSVIRKRKAALNQLQTHFRDGVQVARWLWVASGKVRFADTERTRRQLDQNGIEFVGKQVRAKHLSQEGSRSAGVKNRRGVKKK